MTLLLLALALCAVGTVASVLFPVAVGRAIGFLLLGAAGIGACGAAVGGLRAAPVVFGSAELHAVLRLDSTAAFFIAVVGAVAVLVAVFGLGPVTRDERRNGRTAAATACAIAFASFLACAADDVLLFVFAWELLALTFFWAIAYAGNDPNAPRAAYVTIVVTHVAGACLIGALLFLAHLAGSFAVEPVIAAGAVLAPGAAGIVLLLLLFGFGAKFGILPLQVWMPYGYPAAPPLVAALMAGGALNVGFYGVARFIVGFPHPPQWFAVIAIALGALSAFFGIAWAAVQRDLRALAAYSSVENAGVILAAFGVAVAGRTLHLDLLVGFAIAAAFMQIVAHAAAKATLFLCIGVIRDRCGTDSLDTLGGLARSMPIVTVVVLVCGVSLAALPPMAGFVGEWLVLELLMQAFRTATVAFEVTFAIAGALIGVAAGVTIVTFTKVVGIGLLGAPRSRAASEATQTPSPWQLGGLAVGALCILVAGIAATPLLRLLATSIDSIAHVRATTAIIGAFPLVQPTFTGFSSISALGLGCVIGGFTLGFWVLTRLLGRPAARPAAVWTSGEPYRPWTQYTGTGYANPTRVILRVKLFFDLPFYRAIFNAILRASEPVRSTQSGAIGAYLSYILVFTIILLILYPSIRHW